MIPGNYEAVGSYTVKNKLMIRLLPQFEYRFGSEERSEEERTREKLDREGTRVGPHNAARYVYVCTYVRSIVKDHRVQNRMARRQRQHRWRGLIIMLITSSKPLAIRQRKIHENCANVAQKNWKDKSKRVRVRFKIRNAPKS